MSINVVLKAKSFWVPHHALMSDVIGAKPQSLIHNVPDRASHWTVYTNVSQTTNSLYRVRLTRGLEFNSVVLVHEEHDVTKELYGIHDVDLGLATRDGKC